jgi:hypothetical protein
MRNGLGVCGAQVVFAADIAPFYHYEIVRNDPIGVGVAYRRRRTNYPGVLK